MAHTDIWLA